MSDPRYAFDEIKSALRKHWGLDLRRGGEMGDGDARHDGRWTIEYSRTGFVVGGDIPGRGHGFVRYETLRQVVKSCDLAKVLARARTETADVSARTPQPERKR